MEVKHVFLTASRRGCVEEPLKSSPAATLATYSGKISFPPKPWPTERSNDKKRFQTLAYHLRSYYVIILTLADQEEIPLQVEEWSQCSKKEFNKTGRGDLLYDDGFGKLC